MIVDDAEKFRKHLEWASNVVASWPAWKRNMIRDMYSCSYGPIRSTIEKVNWKKEGF